MQILQSHDAPYKPIITNCVDTQNFDPVLYNK